jgi:hypothetical protein
VINPRPLLLDSTVLLSYERDLTRRAQAFVVQAMTDGRVLVVPALSLAVAAAELAGRNRELSWLVDDPEGPLQILPLSMNALDVGTLAAELGPLDVPNLELAHVVCEARDIRAVVLTYEPKLYDGQTLDVINMRPQ